MDDLDLFGVLGPRPRDPNNSSIDVISNSISKFSKIDLSESGIHIVLVISFTSVLCNPTIEVIFFPNDFLPD